MSIITASQAQTATTAALEPIAEDLDIKYSIFDTVIRSAMTLGFWSQNVSVSTRNFAEFKQWAMTLGFTILPVLADTAVSVNVDGLGNETQTVCTAAWRRVQQVTLLDRVLIHEGDSLEFQVLLEGYMPGDSVYWTNTGTTNAEDFGAGPAALRPQGAWLTVKSAAEWALENSAMSRLLSLKARASDTQVQAQLDLAIAELKLNLEYAAGLTTQDYAVLLSEYQGELICAADLSCTVRLVVVADLALEIMTGVPEAEETLIINIWADPECTQLLFTSQAYTVANQV